MLGRRIYQYWSKWKTVVECHQVLLKTKFKDRVIQIYKGQLRRCLTQWKSAKNVRNKQKKKMKMVQVEMECNRLQQDIVLVKNENRNKAEAVRSARSNKTPKLMK